MDSSRWAIWRFYAYKVSVSNGFYLPVSVIYLQRVLEFGLGDIGIILGTFSIGRVLAEIPTGYLGDRLGRRASLVLGNILIASFMFGYTTFETVPAFVIIHVFWAIGWTFRSGTADAWLYELLAETGDEHRFTAVRSRASATKLAFEAATAASAGLIVTVNWGLPFLANGIVTLLGIPILLSLPPSNSSVEDPDIDDSVFTVSDAKATLVRQVRRPELRWFVAYAALFSTLYSTTRIFEQPALDTEGLSVVALGFLYAGFKIASAAAASTADWFKRTVGVRGVFLLLMPVYGTLFVGLFFFPVLIVPVLVLNRSMFSVTAPLRNQYLNDRLSDVGRATMLSTASMVFSTVGGLVKIATGYTAEVFGLFNVLLAGGIGIVAIAGILWVGVSPVRSSNETRSKRIQTSISD